MGSLGISGTISTAHAARPVTILGCSVIWKLIALLDLHVLLNAAALTKEIQGLVDMVWLINGQSSLGQFTARCQIIGGFVGDGGFRGSEFG